MDLLDMESLFQRYVLAGGALMWVLVPCSLLMVGAVLQGFIALRRGRVLPRWVARLAGEARDEAARVAYLKKLRSSSSPLARVVWLTLKETMSAGKMPEKAVLEDRLEEAIIIVSDRMYDLVGLLSTIYTIGPLLGLVGTIHGLMEVFHQYGAMEHPSVQMLSVGVQKALVTTFWGLSMSIPAFVAGQWMQKKVRAYERDLFPEQAWRAINALQAASSAASPEGEAQTQQSASEPGPERSTLVTALLATPAQAESEA